MNKRGLSGIITTTLIILITLVAIAIVFVIVRPLVGDSVGKTQDVAGNCLSFILEPTRCTYSTSNEVLVSVVPKRGSASGTLSGARLVFGDGTNSLGFSQDQDFVAFKSYYFPFNLSFRPQNVLVSGIANQETCSPLASPLPCIGAVCGNTIVEAGEACEGVQTSHCVHASPAYYGSGACVSCDVPDCIQNDECGDGLDNDGDDRCDFSASGYPCLESGVQSDDPGCWSVFDDESPANFNLTISRPDPTAVYQSATFPYDLVLDFALDQGFQSVNTSLSSTCSYSWINLDNSAVSSGGEVSVPNCDHVGSYTSQLQFPEGGNYRLTVTAKDASGDPVQRNITFTIVSSILGITSPQQSALYQTLPIQLNFTTGPGFTRSNCSYTWVESLNGTARTNSPVEIPCGPTGPVTFNLASLRFGSYNLTVFARTAAGVEANDSLRFIYDPCPGDIETDNVTNIADLSRVIGASWNTSGQSYCVTRRCGDLNRDGWIYQPDLNILLGNWGRNYTLLGRDCQQGV